MPKHTFSQICEYLESKGCKLLTTNEEFVTNNMHCRSRYTIISKCGHENTVRLDMMKAKDTGVYCKDCINTIITNKLNNFNLENKTFSLDTEYNGFVVLRDTLQSHNMEVLKLREGTLADFLIKPRSIRENKWLPIQLKVTNKPNLQNCENYSFKLPNDYSSMLVVCFCLQDHNLWVIPGAMLKTKSLSIGRQNSKYKNYQKTLDDLPGVLLDIYTTGTVALDTYENFNNPISKAQQQEVEYIKLRESQIDFLNFEYPVKDGRSFDFIVNDMRVQEKVAIPHLRKDCNPALPAYYVKLVSHTPYILGDNAVYWIHVKNKTSFYLIPEAELYSRGYVVSHRGDKPTKHVLYFNKQNTWIDKYIYDYNTIDIDTKCKILSIFNIYENHGMSL